MKIEYPLVHFLVLLIFLLLLLLWPILQSARLTLSHRQAPQERKPKTPRPLKPKTADDCPHCRAEKESPPAKPGDRPTPPPWCEVRNRRGRKKSISTQGHACNNPKCIYYHIMDEDIHALVGYGCHGKLEKIQDLMCQACKKKSTVRRDTALYRLKTHSKQVAQALAFMAEGVDVSTLERVTGIGEGTLRTWLTRAGLHAEKLHSIIFQELIFRHIQLDELWANVRHTSEQMWLWVATEATTKLIPVLKLGPRTLDMAMSVIHELCQRMPPGCTPIFSSDGLKLYFYALTAHIGKWVLPQGAHKPVWEIAAGFLYAQVKKTHRRLPGADRKTPGEGRASRAVGRTRAVVRRPEGAGTEWEDQHRLRRAPQFDHPSGCRISAAAHLGYCPVHSRTRPVPAVVARILSFRPLPRILAHQVLPTGSA